MREFKFRIWDKERKYYFTQGSIYAANGVISANEIVDGEKRRFVLQQFIGLHDKDGREIFEGDILKVDADNENPGVIKWSKNGCYLLIKKLMNSKESTSKQVNKGSTKFWTVIGNIFETPEFLE